VPALFGPDLGSGIIRGHGELAYVFADRYFRFGATRPVHPGQAQCLDCAEQPLAIPSNRAPITT
jgi:hypothetical protein